MSPLGVIIRRRLRALGRTQHMLAAAIGVRHETLSRWMSGTQSPATRWHRALAAALEVPWSEIEAALAIAPATARVSATQVADELHAVATSAQAELLGRLEAWATATGEPLAAHGEAATLLASLRVWCLEQRMRLQDSPAPRPGPTP